MCNLKILCKVEQISYFVHPCGTHLNKHLSFQNSGADPGFLERGFICIKVLGFALLILSHFSEISHEERNVLVSLGPFFLFA